MYPTKPTISAIVAMSENSVIGYHNYLPWHLPADLKHFKQITNGHPILMGRKTHESIGIPLPNRTNIIISRNDEYQSPGCLVVCSLEEAIECALTLKSNEIFIIGGAEVYTQLMDKIERIYLTIVHETFEGDTFFPEIDKNEWREIENVKHQPDEKNEYAYSFILLERKEKTST